jgi:hypothetical protein
VAILVPAAIVAAIAVSVVGGGGGVGSLGQVLAGPAVPPAEASTPPPSQHRRDGRPLTATAPAARVRPPAVPRRRGARNPAARSPTTLPPGPRRPGRPPAAAPSPPPSAPPSAQPPPAQPKPPPAQHPIHDTGSQVAGALRPLPVAGPAAADAVQAVVDLVDPRL